LDFLAALFGQGILNPDFLVQVIRSFDREYAVMVALILVLVVGTIRLVGSNANNAFSSAASSIQ